MTVVRTVLGDIEASEMGITYSHEHLIIDGGKPVELFPDFRLDDVDAAVEELAPVIALGLGTVVDAMPCDAGRNVLKLAEISRRTGVHIIAPTGLHHERYYDSLHWSRVASAAEITELLTADIDIGIDERDYGGPLVRRTSHRAGVIKVAGSLNRLSGLEEKVFEAAAAAHNRTGCPILTHCEQGTTGTIQADLLSSHGVDAESVALSHVDKVVDRGYHRELFDRGVFVEYDQAFRWPQGEDNRTLRLLEWAAEDGNLGQVVLGLDAARRSYWRVHGGSPGMTYLLDHFVEAMRERGLDTTAQKHLFVTNPARLYSFSQT
ncbi:MAG: phosphotriesterase family protein [Acidimicrobiia bacterium]